jgi:hypothetical protein
VANGDAVVAVEQADYGAVVGVVTVGYGADYGVECADYRAVVAVGYGADYGAAVTAFVYGAADFDDGAAVVTASEVDLVYGAVAVDMDDGGAVAGDMDDYGAVAVDTDTDMVIY